MRYQLRAVVISVVASIGVSLPASAELPSYQFRNLGTLGGPGSVARAINNAGWVTGFADPDPSVGQLSHPFLWDGSTMQDLSTGASPGYWDESEPRDINATGQVTGLYNNRPFFWDGATLHVWQDIGDGAAVNDSGQVAGHYMSSIYELNHAMVWDGTTVTDLGVFFANTDSAAVGINNSGQVIGYYYYYVSGSGSGRAFLWDGTMMHELPRLDGTWSWPADINESGQVVGTAHVAGNTAMHAVLWDGGAVHDLGTLGGKNSHAARISDSGLVLGAAETADGVTHPFIWDGTTMRNLGALPGDVCGPSDINELGQAVGYCRPSPEDGTARTFLWDGAELQDLADLVIGLVADVVWPTAINDAGQIVGYVRVANEIDVPSTAFIATPILKLFADLLTDSTAVGPDRKLSKQVTVAQTYYEADDLQATCSQLAYFNSQVQKLPPKKTSQTVKDDLIGQSAAIMDAVGCP